MKSIIPLVMLWVCGAWSEPLGAAIQRRSSRSGVYASDYTRGYQPYAFMAIPLHAPMPVLHVLASEPLFRPNRGVNKAIERPRIYAASMSHMLYAPPPPPESEVRESATEVLYARPNPRGGYYYSKRPNRKRAPVRPPPEPVIIRVHKYRIIKDDI